MNRWVAVIAQVHKGSSGSLFTRALTLTPTKWRQQRPAYRCLPCSTATLLISHHGLTAQTKRCYLFVVTKHCPLNNANVFPPAFTNIWNNAIHPRVKGIRPAVTHTLGRDARTQILLLGRRFHETFCKMLFFSLFVKFTSKSSGSGLCCGPVHVSKIMWNCLVLLHTCTVLTEQSVTTVAVK